MIYSICVSFMQVTSALSISHPEEITKTLKERVIHQWKQDNSGSVINFDNSKCAYQGSYFLNDEQIVLIADHEHWRGRLEMSFSDLIEGRSIDFDKIRPMKQEILPLSSSQSSTISTSNSNKQSWIPWTLAIIGVIAGTYLVVEREKHIKELNSISMSF